MKYVQLGILAALLLVAVLLGLNLLRDRSGPPAEPAVTTATPVPAEESAPATPPATSESTASGSAASQATSSPAATADKPAADGPKRNTPSAKPAAKPVTTASSAAKPSPAGTKPAEVATVDPPSAAQDTRSIPAAPVTAPASSPASTETASSSTNRYEIMRPETKTISSANLPPPPPRTVTIPAGTILTIRTIQTLSSKSNSAGDTFSGTLDQPLVLEDMIIAERGSRVEGRVTEVSESGRVKGLAQLSVTLTKINTSDGQTVAVDTQDFQVEAEKSTKSDATKIGIATGIGAALGAIFGGGKGAAIGAAGGGAAGAGTVLVSKGKPAEIPSETRINFRLEKPLVLTEKINP
jgi:hypothetical protein